MLSTVATIGALLLSAAILLTGNGLQGTLIVVRANVEAFPTAEIGLLVSAYFAGYISGAVLAPRVIMRAGHIRSFAALAAVAAACSLVHALIVDPYVWLVLRATIGFCFCGLYMVVESWLNERTPTETRGRMLSLYRIVDLSCNTVGQLLLTVADPAGYPLFCIVSILICLSLVPVALTRSIAPRPIQRTRIRLARLYRLSPLGLVGCLGVGLANGAFWGLAPVFVRMSGHPVDAVAHFMALAVVGGAVLQWPAGWLSDRFDRRTVLVIVCFASAAVGVGLTMTSGASLQVLLAMAFVYGGAIMPIYSLCVAHTNDHVSSTDFVEASGGLLLVYGIGAAAGPYAASFAMEHWGVWSLFAHTAAVHALVGLFGVYRMTRRSPVPLDRQSAFVAVPRTSPTVAELDPRSVPERAEPTERPA